MAFTMEIENAGIIGIINSLQSMCSVFPFEINERGLGFNVVSDGGHMAFSLILDESMFKNFAFSGEETEIVCVAVDNFTKVSGKMTYPIQMESSMSSGIKLSSALGRQNYNIRAVEESMVDKIISKSEKAKLELENVRMADDAIIIKVLSQDLKMGLRNTDVIGKTDKTNVKITLVGDSLELMVDSIDVDAEATVPLIEPVDGEWERTYNLGYLTNIVKILTDNKEIEVHLFDDARSMLLILPLQDEGKSYCLVNVAPVQQRQPREDVEVEEDDDEFDED